MTFILTFSQLLIYIFLLNLCPNEPLAIFSFDRLRFALARFVGHIIDFSPKFLLLKYRNTVITLIWFLINLMGTVHFHSNSKKIVALSQRCSMNWFLKTFCSCVCVKKVRIWRRKMPISFFLRNVQTNFPSKIIEFIISWFNSRI